MGTYRDDGKNTKAGAEKAPVVLLADITFNNEIIIVKK